jgi:sec-independent protein translocase protein TatC
MKQVDRTRRRRRTNPDAQMTVVDHLRELRRRIGYTLLIVAAGAMAGWFLYAPVMHLLQQPYCSVSPQYRFASHEGDPCVLVFTGVLDGFTTHLKIAILTGVVLTAPGWLYQIWAFITPGLKRNERRYTLAFVATSTLLFAAGAYVSYHVLDRGMPMLLRMGGNDMQAMLTANNYLSFVITTLVIFGLSFELPLLVVMANLVGVLPATALRRTQRVAIFAIFVFAGIVVPSPDPLSMCALAVPMVVLYELAVLIATMHDRSHPRRIKDRQSTEDADDQRAEPLESPMAVTGGSIS